MKMFSGSAPGSVMLMGEHAVLHGQPALCCAIDQRMHVVITPRQDRQIHLFSSRLGNYQTDLENLRIEPPFVFVLTAIERYLTQLPQGFDLAVQAEFCATMGLGSSSAVTVAAVAALRQWLELSLTPQELFAESKAVVLKVQGMGSGADVAAAVFGGIVAYRVQPLEIRSYAVAPELTLVYSGAKVPTSTVIQMVATQQQAEPARYQRLYNEIGACSAQAVIALQEKNWLELGRLMNQHHDLQVALGVSTPLLDELAAQLRRQPGLHGAKISGSGLGDCVIGLGEAPKDLFPINSLQRQAGVLQVPIKISMQGSL